VLYDVALTRDMPITLTVQSLVNALAHVASVISTDSLSDGGQDGRARRAEALAGAATVVRAMEDLLLAPRDLNAREHALRGASACALAFERGTPGAQHALAHLLGGALGVEHAPLHAILLPHFLAHLRATNAAALAELERAVDRDDLDAYVHDLLTRAAAPLSLDALSADPAAVAAALETRPELPAQIAIDAQHGLRPPGRSGRIDLGSDPIALIAGPHPSQAARVVLALHGRGAEAGSIVRRVREIVGHDPSTSVVGLRAEGGAERWYAVRYGEAGAGSDPEVLRAIERVETAIATLRVQCAEVHLAGFSQGSCLALEVAARHQSKLASVIAPCGARIGQSNEWNSSSLAKPYAGQTTIATMQDPNARAADDGSTPASTNAQLVGLRVLVGSAQYDKWIARADLDATIAWFREAGAFVDDVSGPGERHEITLRQRHRARQLVLGPAPRSPIGFGNTLVSEAMPGAVPAMQNTPRVAPYGLYPEQLNGTGFTAPRAENQRVWLYRVRPSGQRRAFSPLGAQAIGASTIPPWATPATTAPAPASLIAGDFEAAPEINLCGFPAMPAASGERDFVDGLVTLCGAGSARSRRGYAFHRYSANRSMESRAFYNADGDLIVMPERGALTVATELGVLEVRPGQLLLLPRGIVFSVLLHEKQARGYVAEAFGRHFKLPERGPIGANGLADPRHFVAPSAWFEDRLAPDFRVVAKLGGVLHEASQDHSPFDVAGWHGNYAPFVYDMDMFSPVGNTRFDHGDPSVYTVLSAPMDEAGSHTLDLVVFPPRIDATTGTFRPPFFHRNPVAEINGIIREAGAPPASVFQPGCVFITPSLTAHGPSGRAVERIRGLSDEQNDAPVKLGGENALWFQFESALSPVLTPWAKDNALPEWAATWGSHRSYF
jgi:homogentisate 1,2-dioxygenase